MDETADTADGDPSTRRTPVPAYLLGFVLIGLALTFAGPALSHLRDRMHTDDGGIAWVFVGQSTGYIAGSALAGRGLDRGRGHVRWVTAMGATTVAVVGVAAAPGMPVLVASFALLGAACGLGDVSGNTLVMWSRPQGAGSLLNALHLCFALGALAAPVVVNRAIHYTGSVWPVAAPVGVLTLVCASLMLRHPSPRRTRLDTVAQSTAGGARSLHVALVAAFFFAYVALEAGFAGWIHTYVEQSGAGDGATATGVVTVFWAGFTAGRVLAIAVARRVSAGWMVAVSTGSAVVASLLLAVGREGPMLWVSTALFAVSIAPQYASMIAFAEAHLALSGRNTAVLVGASGIGGLFMPWLLGQLFDATGPRALPPAMVVAAVITLAVAMAAGRSLRSAQRPPLTSMNVPVT